MIKGARTDKSLHILRPLKKIIRKKIRNYLVVKNKLLTFAPAFQTEGIKKRVL